MDLALDTNSLFTFFWKGSLIKKLLLAGHNLYSPEFALGELKKHKPEILSKTKISSPDFDELVNDLQELVKFVSFPEYSNKIPEAFNLLSEHAKDIDFLSLALKLNSAIPSNDKELKKQSKVKIFDKSKFSELF